MFYHKSCVVRCVLENWKNVLLQKRCYAAARSVEALKFSTTASPAPQDVQVSV